MQSLDRMVYDILHDLRDVSSRRFSQLDAVRAINETIDIVVPELIAKRQDLLANIDNGGDPVVLPTTVAGSDGTSKIPLPVGCVRVIDVEVFTGVQWVSIMETKRGPWLGGRARPSPQSLPAWYTSWEVVAGRYLKIDPGFSAVVNNVLRVKYEAKIPKLVMGKVTAPVADGFTLPITYDETLGQEPYEPIDDYYNGYAIRIYGGTGAIQDRIVSDLVGSTGALKVSANFAPAIDATSLYAMVTPFFGPLQLLDLGLKIRACIVLLGTKRNEDLSAFVSRYNEWEEKMLSQLSSMSSEPKEILPDYSFESQCL